ncbi:MAG: hypothetical protein HW399_334 [Dehalococcoidia bacterium]|nr:hypothetical protein [Dehalococcoidia bacterium]
MFYGIPSKIGANSPKMSFPRRRESSCTTPPGFRIKFGITGEGQQYFMLRGAQRKRE